MSFPKKTPDETKLATFDFSTEAAAGTTLSNPTVTITHLSGDGTAADLTASGEAVQDQTVTVFLSGGLSGARYRVSCEADASNGEHHRIDKDLPVSETGALVR